jgi:hypothetical protein
MRNRPSRTESRARPTSRRIDRHDSPVRHRPQRNRIQSQEQNRTREKLVHNLTSHRKRHRQSLSQSVRIGTKATRASGAPNRRPNALRPADPHKEAILATGREATHLAYPRSGSGEIGNGKGAGDGMALGEGSQPGSWVALETGGPIIALGCSGAAMVASTSLGLSSVCPSEQGAFFALGGSPLSSMVTRASNTAGIRS